MRKTMSASELATRRFHKDKRTIIKLCDIHNIPIKTFKEALDDNVCVLSKNDYDIGSTRKYLSEDNEQLFVADKDYEEVYNFLYP